MRLSKLNCSFLQSIKNHISKSNSNQTLPIVMINFDEKVNMFESGNVTQYHHALRRVLASLKMTSLWSVFLSTNSQISDLIPNRSENPSARISRGMHTLYQPYTSFELNLRNKQLLGSNAAELRRPLTSFADYMHVAMFGRPLWESTNPGARVRANRLFEASCWVQPKVILTQT